MLGTSVTTAPEWAHLKDEAKAFSGKHLRELFAQEPTRIKNLIFAAPNLSIDFSRQRINSDLLEKLVSLARTRQLPEAITSMFSGRKINNTENRSVLHTALRMPKSESLVIDGQDVVPLVHDVLDQMRRFATQIRSGDWLGATGKPIKHVVNIGIGGSDLGPVMASEALKPYCIPSIEFHFVSNVDAADLAAVLSKIEPEQTLFIVASKTFTTQETMLNATSAREYLLKTVSANADELVAKHFVALSTNSKKVTEFGISPENMFGFWDWVGGRYSMDSAIGLSTMIAIGPENFSELLSGFHEMDKHFASTPLEQNVPALLGLIGLWNRSLLGISSVAVLPYDQNLKRFPAYLQQLIMESNGKSVTRDGLPVEVETGAIYWGEPGTNGQHSFYQLIHQGTSVVACDILYPAKTNAPIKTHHDVLISNAIGQAAVLAFGRTEQELRDNGVSENLIPHKVMPGNRPTTLITFTQLTPRVLGSLVSLYEHMVFVQGVIWGINSFDQWGVELGKELANAIAPYLANQDEVSTFDSATANSIREYRKSK